MSPLPLSRSLSVLLSPLFCACFYLLHPLLSSLVFLAILLSSLVSSLLPLFSSASVSFFLSPLFLFFPLIYSFYFLRSSSFSPFFFPFTSYRFLVLLRTPVFSHMLCLSSFAHVHSLTSLLCFCLFSLLSSHLLFLSSFPHLPLPRCSHLLPPPASQFLSLFFLPSISFLFFNFPSHCSDLLFSSILRLHRLIFLLAVVSRCCFVMSFCCCRLYHRCFVYVASCNSVFSLCPFILFYPFTLIFLLVP